MKKTAAGFFCAVLCSAGLTIGLCFCVVTSFAVPVTASLLLCACFCGAILTSAVLCLPKSWIWVLALTLLTAGGIWLLLDAVTQSLSALLYAVSEQYAAAFSGLQAIRLTAQPESGDAALILALLALVYALLCGWTVRCGQSMIPLLLACVPVLALCLVILQTPPAAWAILLVLGSLVLMLLSQPLRHVQPTAGNQLALRLAVPLYALVALLAFAFPAGSYTRAQWSDNLQKTISDTADKLTLFRRDADTGQVKFVSPISPSTLGSYPWDSSVTSVNLNRIGPQRQYGRSVMRVQAQSSGRCHLRGDSLAVYEDNRWKALPEDDDPDGSIPEDVWRAGAGQTSGWSELQIETNMKSGIYYTPYYPAALPEDAEAIFDAYIRNPSQQTSYAVSYAAASGSGHDANYESFVHEVYTQVPEETRQALSDILMQLGVQAGQGTGAIAAAVQSYVAASAQYDLDTPAVPSGEDFVSWFLHESETGYCVHFATAAAILLRCLDVPARYVTGYYTTVTADTWTTVTSDDAHAWVEYYVNGKGWCVLDPTPAAADAGQQTGTTEPANTAEADPTPEQPQPSMPETAPSKPDNQQKNSEISPENTEKSEKLHIFQFIWPILMAAAVLLIWRTLLFSIRRTAIQRGSANRRAIVLYHHICWLSRQATAEVPEQDRALAEKARFSHHKLNEAELAPLREQAEQLTAQLLSDRHFWKQFLYRVIYALG